MLTKLNARVLIADDQESARKALKGLIESCLGWEVCGQAENGEQAIQMSVDLRPDMIVLDLSMPVMDGLAAARGIAEIMPHVPIVIYTFYVSPELVAEAKKAGVRLVVDKAGTREKLLNAMTYMLGSSGVPAGGPENFRQSIGK